MSPFLLAAAKPLATLVAGAFFSGMSVYSSHEAGGIIGEGVELQFEPAEVVPQLEKRVPAKPNAPVERAEKPEDE